MFYAKSNLWYIPGMMLANTLIQAKPLQLMFMLCVIPAPSIIFKAPVQKSFCACVATQHCEVRTMLDQYKQRYLLGSEVHTELGVWESQKKG